MGGPVSDLGSSVGDIGPGVINGVSDLGVSIDQGVRNTLGPNGWTLAALMAAGYYYAPEIGAYVNASGSTVPASAVIDAGATDASLGAAGTANAGLTLPAIPPEVSAISNANSVANAVSGNAATAPTTIPSAVPTAGEMTAQQTADMKAKDKAVGG